MACSFSAEVSRPGSATGLEAGDRVRIRAGRIISRRDRKTERISGSRKRSDWKLDPEHVRGNLKGKAMLRGMNKNELDSAERLLRPFTDRIIERPLVNEQGERSILVHIVDGINEGATQFYSLSDVKECVEGLIAHQGRYPLDD